MILTNIYNKAQELNATGIMIKCNRVKIFTTEIVLSFKLNDKWIEHSYLHNEDYKAIISFLESKIAPSKSEVKEKTYFDKALSFESNSMLVSRHLKSLFIEFNKEEAEQENVVYPFSKVA